MDLHEIRTQIDLIDQHILRLLHQRMEFALRARKQKTELTDRAREEAVLRNVINRATGLLEYPFVASLFQTIISESKEVQGKDSKLVGFQGEHGAWGDLAVRSLGPNQVPVPSKEFIDLFTAVANKDIDYGVVPIENSIEGGINEVNDLLVETDVQIISEVKVAVHQHLLVLPGTDYRELKVVYSHPQALAQCRAFLRRNKLEARPFYDTAGAAKWLAQERPQAAAVIASSLAADLYGLEVVKENIEDNAHNVTRFVQIADKASAGHGRNGNKCTLVFTTKHRAGALFEVLKAFAENGINLTRIESRPMRKEPGVFAFLLDFLGNEYDSAVHGTLKRLRESTVSLKVLGFYQEAVQ